MKRGTTPALPVKLGIDFANVASVTFVFKERKDENAEAKLYKGYPDVVQLIDGILYVPFSEEDTRLFDGVFYMDTMIEMTDGTVPETKIVELYMNPTLFEEGWQDK